jgi:DNA-binding NarL/FixJ family response regulator
MINIVIVDDHPLVINGVKDMLSSLPHMVVRNTYINGKSLLEGLQEHLPDVLLLDINLPDIRGEELMVKINKIYPNLKVITLTNFDNTLYASRMMHNGAKGYLLKNVEKQVLISAIESVYNGGKFIAPELEQRIAELQKKLSKSAYAKASLTPREIEILKLLAKGQTNQQIADTLFLSKRTVENYRLNLSTKLEVNNTAGLVKYAMENGLDK